MAKKYEFKPDKPRSGFLSKLYLTQKQRRGILKWGLYALVLLVLSVLQDVVLSRVSIFGATTDLVPCGIFVICVLEGAERSCVFALIAAMVYLFSGTAPGMYAPVFIVVLAVFLSIFRQAYFQRSLSATLLCVGIAMAVYELAVFAIGLFLNLTVFSRIGGFGITMVLTLICVPVLYPICLSIESIGGEAWKE